MTGGGRGTWYCRVSKSFASSFLPALRCASAGRKEGEDEHQGLRRVPPPLPTSGPHPAGQGEHGLSEVGQLAVADVVPQHWEQPAPREGQGLTAGAQSQGW